MTAIATVAVLLTAAAPIIAAAMWWEARHTCSLPGCDEWTPETGPARLCPHHRYTHLEPTP